MESGLADPHHRSPGQRARRIQPCVVEAREHVTIHATRLASGDFGEQAGQGDRLVVEAFDRLRAGLRVHRDDPGAWRGDALGGATDRGGHRRRGVGVDDEDLHRSPPQRPRACRRLSVRNRSSETRMTANETVVVTVPSA